MMQNIPETADASKPSTEESTPSESPSPTISIKSLMQNSWIRLAACIVSGAIIGAFFNLIKGRLWWEIIVCAILGAMIIPGPFNGERERARGNKMNVLILSVLLMAGMGLILGALFGNVLGYEMGVRGLFKPYFTDQDSIVDMCTVIGAGLGVLLGAILGTALYEKSWAKIAVWILFGAILGVLFHCSRGFETVFCAFVGGMLADPVIALIIITQDNKKK